MFILTDSPVIREYPYSDGVSLSFREFTDAERDRFDLERSKLVGRKAFGEKFRMLLSQVARDLCVGWSGVQDPDSKPLECNAETRAKFFGMRATEKYWWRPIYRYCNPILLDGEMLDEDEEQEAKDPNFFGDK